MRRLPALQIIGGSCTLCTLLVFFTPVHAAAHGIKWDGHDPTMAQTPERSETTKISAPTTARTALTSTITTRPSLPDGGVLRRALASDTICGWDMGMISSPIICGPTNSDIGDTVSCAFINSNYVGCCGTVICVYHTTCYDATVYSQLPAGSNDDLALVCTTTATSMDTRWSTLETAELTECVSHIWTASGGGGGFLLDYASMTSWSCGTFVSMIFVETTAILDPVSVALPYLVVSADDSIIVATETPSSPSGTVPPEGGRDTSTIVIAVGVSVGGIAILIIFGVGVWWMRRKYSSSGSSRRSKNKTEPSAAVPLMAVKPGGTDTSLRATTATASSHPVSPSTNSAIDRARQFQEVLVLPSGGVVGGASSSRQLGSPSDSPRPTTSSPHTNPQPSRDLNGHSGLRGNSSTTNIWSDALRPPNAGDHVRGLSSPQSPTPSHASLNSPVLAPRLLPHSEIRSMAGGPSPVMTRARPSTAGSVYPHHHHHHHQAYMGSRTGIDQAWGGSP